MDGYGDLPAYCHCLVGLAAVTAGYQGAGSRYMQTSGQSAGQILADS